MTPTESTLTDTKDLGLALLIAESDDGGYEPVAVVATLAEARELAANDFRRRAEQTETGREQACPAAYKLWRRNAIGAYEVAGEIPAL